MTFQPAQRAAIAALNDPEPLSVVTWADDVRSMARALDRIHVDDPAVASAARLAGVIAHQEVPRHPSEFRKALRSVSVQDRDTADKQARDTLAILTHAAAPGVTTEPHRSLIASVEERFLQSPQRAEALPLREAIDQWRDAVPLSAPALRSPMFAASLAFYQAELLRTASATLERVDADPAIETDRLQQLLTDGTRYWTDARTKWLSETNEGPAPGIQAAAQSLSLASRPLRDALGTQLLESPSATLETLIATRLGGQDTAAMSLAAVRGSREQVMHGVVTLSADLAAAAQVIDANHRGGFTDRQPTQQLTRQVLTSVQEVTRPRVEITPEPRQGVEIPETPYYLSADEQLELVRRRDAGVIAQAALDGNPDAQALAAHAKPEELAALAADGRQAKAQLVASASMIAYSLSNRVHNDDAYSEIQLSLLSAADRYDPQRGASWATFAYNEARWGMGAFLRKTARDEARSFPIDVQEDIQIVDPKADPTTRALASAEVQPILEAIDALPSTQREALRAYLAENLAGQNTSVSEIARTQPVSESSLRRRLSESRETLRGTLTEQGVHVPPATDSRSRAVERLRAAEADLDAPAAPTQPAQPPREPDAEAINRPAPER